MCIYTSIHTHPFQSANVPVGNYLSGVCLSLRSFIVIILVEISMSTSHLFEEALYLQLI